MGSTDKDESEAKTDSEERTALEDVFRFDSEMSTEINQPAPEKNIKGAKVDVEDLSDALKDETDDSEAETGGKKCETTTDDEVSCSEADKPVLSSSYPGTSSCSEGSAASSPWATKTK